MGTAKNRTHKATAKRFKITSNGKAVHERQYNNSHLKTNKNNRTLRRQEGSAVLSSKAESKKMASLILG